MNPRILEGAKSTPLTLAERWKLDSDSEDSGIGFVGDNGEKITVKEQIERLKKQEDKQND